MLWRIVVLSEYSLKRLRDDGEFNLNRAHANKIELPSVLLLAPASTRPSPETLKKIDLEYSLRSELDSAWAGRPLALSERSAQMTLVLEGPGGETLDGFMLGGDEDDAVFRLRWPKVSLKWRWAVRQLFVFLSGLTIAIAYIPFIRGTIKGSVVPNRASWIVWFIQDVLLASSAIVAGVGPSAVMPVIWGVGAGIMLILSVTKGTRGTFTGLEKACLVLSGLGLLLWATTGSPRLALVASVSAACIGGVPTVVKAWVKPWTETLSGWLLLILGTVFSSLANREWTFDSGLLPVVIGLFQLSVATPLVVNTLKGSVRTEEQNVNPTRLGAWETDVTGGE
jgi:hypothetical protein